MNRPPMILVVFVTLAAAAALTPTGALAQRAPGMGHGGGRASSTRMGTHFAPGFSGARSRFHHPFRHQGAFRGALKGRGSSSSRNRLPRTRP